METLFNGYTLDIPAGCFPLSTDSMVLADFVKLPRKASVLDLGSGCGTLGLLLCARDPGCTVTGVEIDTQAHQAAQENISRNALSTRMKSICADLRTIPESLPLNGFDCCISNPPYFCGGFSSQSAPVARQETCCSLEQVFAAAAWSLKYGGDFFLIHKPERLAELCKYACAHALEPKRLKLVRHHPGGDVILVLLACRKGGKPGLRWEELCLFDEANQPTQDYRTLYHL